MNLLLFNEALKRADPPVLVTFVQKHLFHGTPVVFEGREEEYFDFRNRIATKFKIGYHEVFIIGSAKQGFSYYKNRDSFTLESDVDVAIVSYELFNMFSDLTRDFQYRLSAAKEVISDEEEKEYRRYLRWMARGWIRPDLAPMIFKNEPDWENFFSSISNGKSEVGNYQVEAGVFKSYDDLQTYHYHGILSHYMKLITEAR